MLGGKRGFGARDANQFIRDEVVRIPTGSFWMGNSNAASPNLGAAAAFEQWRLG